MILNLNERMKSRLVKLEDVSIIRFNLYEKMCNCSYLYPPTLRQSSYHNRKHFTIRHYADIKNRRNSKVYNKKLCMYK